MIRTEDRGAYFFVSIEQPFEFSEIQRLISQVAEYCREHGIVRALGDLRHMEGTPTVLQRFQLGITAIEVFFPVIQKGALVYKPEAFHKFTEDVIVNRGGNLRVFSDFDSALNWLLA